MPRFQLVPVRPSSQTQCRRKRHGHLTVESQHLNAFADLIDACECADQLLKCTNLNDCFSRANARSLSFSVSLSLLYVNPNDLHVRNELLFRFPLVDIFKGFQPQLYAQRVCLSFHVCWGAGKGGGGAEGGSKAERDRASKGNKGEVDTEIDEVRFCA